MAARSHEKTTGANPGIKLPKGKYYDASGEIFEVARDWVGLEALMVSHFVHIMGEKPVAGDPVPPVVSKVIIGKDERGVTWWHESDL